MWSLVFERKKMKNESLKRCKEVNIDGWQYLFVDIVKSAVDPPKEMLPAELAAIAQAQGTTGATSNQAGNAANANTNSTTNSTSTPAPPSTPLRSTVRTGSSASPLIHPTPPSTSASSPAHLRVSSAAARRAAVANAAQHIYEPTSLVNSLNPAQPLFSRISTLFENGQHPFFIEKGRSYTLADLPRVRDRLLMLEWLMEYKLNDQPDSFMSDIRRGVDGANGGAGAPTNSTATNNRNDEDEDEERIKRAEKMRPTPLGVDHNGHTYYQLGDEKELYVFRERTGDKPAWSIKEEYGFASMEFSLDDSAATRKGKKRPRESTSSAEDESDEEEESDEGSDAASGSEEFGENSDAGSDSDDERTESSGDESEEEGSDNSSSGESTEEEEAAAAPSRQSRNSQRAAAASASSSIESKPAVNAKSNAKSPAPTPSSANSKRARASTTASTLPPLTPSTNRSASANKPTTPAAAAAASTPTSSHHNTEVNMEIFHTPKQLAMQQKAMEQLERLKQFHLQQLQKEKDEKAAREREEAEDDEDEDDEEEDEEEGEEKEDKDEKKSNSQSKGKGNSKKAVAVKQEQEQKVKEEKEHQDVDMTDASKQPDESETVISETTVIPTASSSDTVPAASSDSTPSATAAAAASPSSTPAPSNPPSTSPSPLPDHTHSTPSKSDTSAKMEDVVKDEPLPAMSTNNSTAPASPASPVKPSPDDSDAAKQAAADAEADQLGYRMIRHPARFAWEVAATDRDTLKQLVEEGLPASVKGKPNAAHKKLVTTLEQLIADADAAEEAMQKKLELKMRVQFQPKKRSSRIEMIQMKKEQEEEEERARQAELRQKEEDEEQQRRQERAEIRQSRKHQMSKRIAELENEIAELQSEHDSYTDKEQLMEVEARKQAEVYNKAYTEYRAIQTAYEQQVREAQEILNKQAMEKATIEAQAAAAKVAEANAEAKAKADAQNQAQQQAYAAAVAQAQEAAKANAAAAPAASPVPMTDDTSIPMRDLNQPPPSPSESDDVGQASLQDRTPASSPNPAVQQQPSLPPPPTPIVPRLLPIPTPQQFYVAPPPVSIPAPTLPTLPPKPSVNVDDLMQTRRMRQVRIDRLRHVLIWRQQQQQRRLDADANFVEQARAAHAVRVENALPTEEVPPFDADAIELPQYPESSDEEVGVARVQKEEMKERRRKAREALANSTGDGMTDDSLHLDSESKDAAAEDPAAEELRSSDDEEVEITGWDEAAINHQIKVFEEKEAKRLLEEQRLIEMLERGEEPKPVDAAAPAATSDAAVAAAVANDVDAEVAALNSSAASDASPRMRTLRTRSPLGRLFLRNSLPRGKTEPGLFFRIRRKKYNMIVEAVIRGKARDRAIRVMADKKRREQRRAQGLPSESSSSSSSESEEEVQREPTPPPAPTPVKKTPKPKVPKTPATPAASASFMDTGMMDAMVASPAAVADAMSQPPAVATPKAPKPPSARALAKLEKERLDALRTPEQIKADEEKALEIRRAKGREARAKKKAEMLAQYERAMMENKIRNGGVTPPPDHPLYIKPPFTNRVKHDHDESSDDESHAPLDPAQEAKYQQAMQNYELEMERYKETLKGAITHDPATGEKLQHPLLPDGSKVKKPRKPSRPAPKKDKSAAAQANVASDPMLAVAGMPMPAAMVTSAEGLMIPLPAAEEAAVAVGGTPTKPRAPRAKKQKVTPAVAAVAQAVPIDAQGNPVMHYSQQPPQPMQAQLAQGYAEGHLNPHQGQQQMQQPPHAPSQQTYYQQPQQQQQMYPQQPQQGQMPHMQRDQMQPHHQMPPQQPGSIRPPQMHTVQGNQNQSQHVFSQFPPPPHLQQQQQAQQQGQAQQPPMDMAAFMQQQREKQLRQQQMQQHQQQQQQHSGPGSFSGAPSSSPSHASGLYPFPPPPNSAASQGDQQQPNSHLQTGSLSPAHVQAQFQFQQQRQMMQQQQQSPQQPHPQQPHPSQLPKPSGPYASGFPVPSASSVHGVAGVHGVSSVHAPHPQMQASGMAPHHIRHPSNGSGSSASSGGGNSVEMDDAYRNQHRMQAMQAQHMQQMNSQQYALQQQMQLQQHQQQQQQQLQHRGMPAMPHAQSQQPIGAPSLQSGGYPSGPQPGSHPNMMPQGHMPNVAMQGNAQPQPPPGP